VGQLQGEAGHVRQWGGCACLVMQHIQLFMQLLSVKGIAVRSSGCHQVLLAKQPQWV